MFATCLKIERYPLLSSYLLRATGDGVRASHAALSGDHSAGRCFEGRQGLYHRVSTMQVALSA